MRVKLDGPKIECPVLDVEQQPISVEISRSGRQTWLCELEGRPDPGFALGVERMFQRSQDRRTILLGRPVEQPRKVPDHLAAHCLHRQRGGTGAALTSPARTVPREP